MGISPRFKQVLIDQYIGREIYEGLHKETQKVLLVSVIKDFELDLIAQFGSLSNYRKFWIKQLGFKTKYQYESFLAQRRGYKNRTELENLYLKKRGFKERKDYKVFLFQKKGFKTFYEYQEFLARQHGFKSHYDRYKSYYAKRRQKAKM